MEDFEKYYAIVTSASNFCHSFSNTLVICPVVSVVDLHYGFNWEYMVTTIKRIVLFINYCVLLEVSL